MKKTTKLFGLFAVAAMTVIGCAKEIDAPKEEVINEPEEKVVETHTVTISAGAPETKTVINEGVSSASFKWSSDDASRFHIWENDVPGTDIALETSDEYATIKLTATFATVDAASYTYTAFLAKNVVNDTDPQVPAAQTCTGTAYDPNADILIAQPVTNEGSVLDKLNMKFGRPCVINKMTLKGLTAGETLSSVEIRADKDLTGYYDIAGKTWEGESSKIVLTTSQTVPASGQVVVYFVTMPVSSATLTVTAITDAHVYDKTFTKTINFVMDQVTTFGVSSLTQYVKRDVLTLPLTTVTGGSYADFSGKSYAGAGHSSAVYAGTIAGGNDAIQLNANSGTSYRGIVTTTSGGSIKKVRVVWESHTVSDRALTIYGKNTAYTTSDLNNSFGTEIGSITSGSTVETTIDSYYEFVMFKAAKAIYLDEIEVFWDNTKSDNGLKWTADGNAGEAVTAATATLNTGDDDMPAAVLYNPNTISLSSVTFSSTDTDVATIGEHTGIISLVGGGSTVIRAVYAGNSTYKPANISYTLTVTDSRSTCETPSFSPVAGAVEKDSQVTISSTTVGSTIYYTLDSSTPTTSSSYSTLVDGSGCPYVNVTIDAAKTLKAIAVKDDWITSSVATASYTLKGVSVKLNNPTGLSISSISNTAFTATWTGVLNASSYDWMLSTSSTAPASTSDASVKAYDNVTSTTATSSTLSLTTGTYYLYVKTKGNGSTYTDADGYASISAVMVYLNCGSNIFSLRTSSGNDASSEITKTVDGYSYKLKATNNCYYYNSQALLIGKKNSYITFPAIENYKLYAVTASNNSGAAEPSVLICGTANTTAITNGSAQTLTKGGTKSWTNLGSSSYTAYRLYTSNSSDKNAQYTKIVLMYTYSPAE